MQGDASYRNAASSIYKSKGFEGAKSSKAGFSTEPDVYGKLVRTSQTASKLSRLPASCLSCDALSALAGQQALSINSQTKHIKTLNSIKSSMKKGLFKHCKELSSRKGRPIKIIGISCGKRSARECAREDPTSLWYLKLALKEAEKAGAKTQLIDLRELKIGACKECYSSNPAQCRFNEKTYQCDCYTYKQDSMLVGRSKILSIEKAYDLLGKKHFFGIYHNKDRFAEQDDMWIVYKAMIEADGVIFATSTNYYGRPALLQTMLSRFCALDGGVEKLWGDGKNLENSIKYSKNPRAKYKQRMYGRWTAFINCSKEGDSVTPGLMKACTMMGMKIIPLAVACRVNWYDDPTHQKDALKSKKDTYTLSLVKHIGRTIVANIKKDARLYGTYSSTV